MTTYEVVDDDGQAVTSLQRPVIVRVSAGQSYSLMVDDQGRVFFAGRFRVVRLCICGQYLFGAMLAAF